MSEAAHILALCGGVGGAKLAHGLARVVAPTDLSIVVNTGDDFTHLGLHISPDIDTVIYTLADLADRHRGWGLAGESWAFMDALRAIGGETWFNLGDRDLATHVERSRLLNTGATLSEVSAILANAHGIASAIIPMSDHPVRTIVECDIGTLAFQHYFVREQCRPAVLRLRFDGVDRAMPSPAFADLLSRPDIAAVLICPSNPYLSIDPILAIPGVRDAIRALGVPVVAVSPIIEGQAIKGPTAKLMIELGVSPGVLAIARHYEGLINAIVIDDADGEDVGALREMGLAVLAAKSWMRDDDDRMALARATVDFARAVRSGL